MRKNTNNIIKNYVVIKIILLFLISSSTLYAKQGSDEASSIKRAYKGVVVKSDRAEEKSVAIVGFKSINCDKVFSETLLKILNAEVAKSKILKLKGSDKNFTSCTDNVCAVELGKELKVQKSIYGTVSKDDKYYKIMIKVIDVESGKIDIDTPTKTSNLDDFSGIIRNSVYAIERIFYKHETTTGRADFSFSFSFLYPVEDITTAAGLGYGLNLFTNVFIKRPWGMFFSLGFYGFSSNMKAIKELYMFPIQVHVSYTFKWGLRFQLIPSLGLGYIFSYMYHDYLRDRPSGDYVYDSEFFANPIFTARTEFDILVYKRLMVVIAPYYSFLLGDNGRRGHFIAFDVGLKVLF